MLNSEAGAAMRTRNLAISAGAAAMAAIVCGALLADPTFATGFFGAAKAPGSQTAPAQEPATMLAQAPAAQPPAPAAPATPVRTETINYGSWTVTCREAIDKSSKRTCSGVLQMIDQQRRQVLLTWIIARDPQGLLRTVIQAPTGVLVQKGIELKLGKSPMRTVPYLACEPQRCEATMTMDDAMVKDSMASQEAIATIFATDGRGINFTLPITGVDKVFASIGK